MHQLSNPATRENALLELSKKRENFPELAPYLWYSFGTVAALLQEIVSIYPLLTPPSLTAHASNRVCNALALLQCVASHPETRGLFLQGEQVTRRTSMSCTQCVSPMCISAVTSDGVQAMQLFQPALGTAALAVLCAFTLWPLREHALQVLCR